jgi:apolipoprotein D and lipocalin family protein
MRLALICLFAAASLTAADREVKVVPSVDLQRYQGRWYEIARLPMRFQRDCASDVTATYSLKENGDVKVVNACREANGKLKQSEGTAKLEDANGPTSKLKVTFFWPFYGKYWVIDLDPNYQWAVVGGPSREYLWVLSRKPRMDEALLNKLLGAAKAQGYDLSRLIRTKHTVE